MNENLSVHSSKADNFHYIEVIVNKGRILLRKDTNMKKEYTQLSLREKIGQTAAMQSSWFMNRKNLPEYLKENPIGNVWHIGDYGMDSTNLTGIAGADRHDCEFFRKWMLYLKELLPVPPFVGMDPLSESFAIGVKNLTNKPAVGAANSEELAYEFGKVAAKQVQSVGGNYLWGPEVDIPSRFNSVCIMRTMSDELDKLCRLSDAYIKGMQEQSVVATAKHFPGMDQTEYRDSHFSPACINSTLDEWKALQGAAFQRMIDQGVYSIMVGHTGFPAVDDRKLGNAYRPATISDKIITGLLKEEMGFEGVVITDAIDMASLAAAYPDRADLYVELLNAGNDLLLDVLDYDYIDIVEKAVKEGRISEERIDDACRRVLEAKEKIGLFDEYKTVIADEKLRCEIADVNGRIAERALTLECDTYSQLPLDASKIHNVAIICSAHTNAAFEALEHMKAAFEARGMKVHLQRRLTSLEEIAKIDRENDLIIYAGYLMPHAPMGASSFYDEECGTFFFALTKGAEKSIGVSLGSVYVYYDFYVNFRMFAHIYNLSKEAQEAFVKGIFGEIPFAGEMPFIKPGPIKRA